MIETWYSYDTFMIYKPKTWSFQIPDENSNMQCNLDTLEW